MKRFAISLVTIAGLAACSSNKEEDVALRSTPQTVAAADHTPSIAAHQAS